MQNSEEPEGTVLGKCKPVPSLRAKRDNMIGNMDKENTLPSLERGKKSKGKRPAASCWSNTYVRRGTATPAHLLCGGDKLRW